jgi:hypothetical protein
MQERDKHWIKDAVAKAGSVRAAGTRAGQSTADSAEGHGSNLDKNGRRARFAETLMGLAKNKDLGGDRNHGTYAVDHN